MSPPFDRPDGYSLNELAAAASMEPRTVRSWVQEGLVPGPVSRGPKASYPPEAMGRLLAVKRLKEDTHLTLADIRRRLAGLSVKEVNAIASGEGAHPEPGSAADYMASISEEEWRRQSSIARRASAYSESSETGARTFNQPSIADMQAARSQPPGEDDIPARARAEPWSKIEVTPDVFIEVRGELEPRSRRRYERLADLVRDWLTRGSIPR